MSKQGNIYIAIVDDDESLCRSLGRLLRASGIQPITYLSAEEFLADKKHPKFDCLVLDIQLGGMSGVELQRQLSAAGEKTPVIFISAYDNPEAREEALAAGCAAYFRKNDCGADVLDAIGRVTRQN
ncbi:MAG: response regulator [Methylacidiphilales bacterium]|nr:response regulator [Candidatus Methylacidiphilales bacterium]